VAGNRIADFGASQLKTPDQIRFDPLVSAKIRV
jgi:hypothetical protein